MNPERQIYMNAAMAGSDQGLGYTTVPMGWNRTIWGDGSVVYVSPSGHLLHCAEDLQRYLLAEGTCKCGLECPLIIDRVFNFNPRVPARPKLPSDVLVGSQLNALCKHRNKLVAMAIGLQGNEETLANIGPPGGVSVFGRSKGSKRSRSKSKPERAVDFQPQNLSASQVLALQGGHVHQIPGFANFMPSLKSVPFEHQLQQHSIESQQRQIQMHLLQMQHQDLMQQHQQMQHQLHHQHRQTPMQRRSQEVESLHSPVEQYSLEQRSGKRLHSSPPSSCPKRPPSNSGSAGSQSAPTSASPHSTTPRCSKSPRLSSELTSPSSKERQPLHGHSLLPLPFHGETHQLIVDGQTLAIHPDACAPSVIPLLSNMYHAQNRASLNAANVSNSQALFANHNDEVFFMQDGSRKGPSRTVHDSVEVPTCQAEDTNKLESKSPVRNLKDNTPSPIINKPVTMHSTKPDKKPTVGNMTLQQIFKQSLEGSAFPASSLLSAAARAQLAKQPQSPDSPSPHHAGDLMSGMGLFNKMSSNLTSKDTKLELAALPSNKGSQFSASRKHVAKSTNIDVVHSSEMNVKGTASAPQQTDESPIQCLENAVQNLKDHPSTLKPAVSAVDVFSPEVTQDSSACRKRLSTDAEETMEKSVKRQRLQSSDSVGSQTKQSEAAMSTHQVPAINSDKPLSMHHHDTTKVTGSYNVVCSTGKATSSSKHPTAENAELARWQQQQQEWYANMLRVKQHHESGNMPVEHFPPGSQVRPPQIRSRGLQELQYIAMGGNPPPRMQTMQQHPHVGHMHRFPNHFTNPQFNPHQANMMHHIHRMQMPFRMDHPVDPLDPNIAQNPSMCNSNILQSMLQQQQQLQQLGMLPPGNFQHPVHHISPVHHLDPSQHIPVAQADVPSLPQAHVHGQDTTNPGAMPQHKKGAKPVRGASTSTSTALTCTVDIDDEEPKDAAYWVKAASKSGGVKKVKDILAMTRSLQKHNSEAGQVEAIFQAVLDSASGGMKVIIKEGTRSQEGVQSGSADNNQEKETDAPPKAAIESTDRSDSMCEVSEQSSVSPSPAQQNAVEPDFEVQDESSDDLLNADAVERPCGESLDQTSELDIPTSQDDFRKAQNLSELSVTQMESNPDTAILKTQDLESVSLDGDEIPCPTRSEGDHMASPIHDETELEPEGSSKVPHQDNVQVITCDKMYTEGHGLGSDEISEWVSPPVEDTCTVSDQVQSITSTDQPIEFPDSPQPAICQSTKLSGEHKRKSTDIKDSKSDDDELQEHVSLSFDLSEDESKVQSDVKDGEEDPPQDQLLEHAGEVRTVLNEHGCSVHEIEPNANYPENPTSDTIGKMDMEDISDGSYDMASLDEENTDPPQTDQRETVVDQVKEVQSTGGQSHTCELKGNVGTHPPLVAGGKDSSDVIVDLLKEEKSPHTSSSLPPSDPQVDTAKSSVKDQRVDETAVKFSQEITSVQHSNDTGNDITVLVSGDMVAGSDMDYTGEVMESKELNSSPDTEVERQGKPVTVQEHEQMDTDAPVVSQIVQQEQALDFQPIDSNIKHHVVMDNQPLDSTVDSEVIQNNPLAGNIPIEQDAINHNQLVDQDSMLGSKVSAQKQQVEGKPGSSEPVIQADQQDAARDSEVVTQGQSIDSESMKQDPNEDDLPRKQDSTEEDLSMTQVPTEDGLPMNQDPTEEDLPMKQDLTEEDLSMNQDPNEDDLPMKQDLTAEDLSMKQDPNEDDLPMKQDLTAEDLSMNQDPNEDDLSMKQDSTEEDLSVTQFPTEDGLPMIQDPSEQVLPMKQDLTEEDLPMKQDPNGDLPMKPDSTEDLPMKQDPTEEDLPMKQVPTEKDLPMKQDTNEEDLPLKQDPIEGELSLKQDPIEGELSMKQDSTEDELPTCMTKDPTEEDLPMKQDPTEEDQPMKRDPNEGDISMKQDPTEGDISMEQDSSEYDLPINQNPDEDDQLMTQNLNADQPIKQDSNEDDLPIPMTLDPTEDNLPIKQDTDEEDLPMKQDLTEDDHPIKQDSNDDQPTKHVPTEEDQPIKKDPIEDEQSVSKDSNKNDLPMKQDTNEGQPMKLNLTEDDWPIKHGSNEDDQPMKQDPTEEDQPMKRDSNEEDEPVKQDPIKEHQQMRKNSNEEHQPMKQDPTTSLDSEQQMDTEPVQQDLENVNHPVTQDPVVDNEQVQQDKPVNQDNKMDDNTMDFGSQPMDIQPVKQFQCLDNEPLEQDHTVADEEVEHDLSVSKGAVEQMHQMDFDQVKQDQDSSVESEPVTQDQLSELMKEVASTEESVKQCHSDNSESLRLDHLENLEIEEKFADRKTVKQHVVDICDNGSSKISEAVYVDLVTSSSFKQDHVVKHESDEQEKLTSVDHGTTDEVHVGSNEQFTQQDTDMPDDTEKSEPVKKDCFAHINLMGQDAQKTTELKVQSLPGKAETSKQSEDPHNQTVDCEPVFGDQLIDGEALKEDKTELVQEDNVDKSLVCMRPDSSREDRDLRPSQVIEVTTCINKTLSSDQDEESPDKSSSNMSLAKLENTLSYSNNPFDGLHTVETQSLETQDADLASERTPEQDHIPSGALLGIQNVPESECFMPPEGDSHHPAADSEAEESTVPDTQCPSEGLEHNLPVCSSVQRLTEKSTLVQANISSEAPLENLASSESRSESSPVIVNGPPYVNVDPPGEEPAPETTSQTEMTAASGQHSLSETPKESPSPQGSTQHRESPTPNGVLESEHLNDIPMDSAVVENQPDKLTYQGTSKGEKQSTSDDERENRENKPLTDEPPVQEICTVKRESNLKRGVSDTQKAVLSAKEAGLKKERLVQEAPTRVLRGNVRADPSTDLTASMFPRHLEIGDLVWGPIRGYPSWPGKLVSETEVRGRSRREEGKMWVRWFGDHSCSQVEPEKLKTLSEGLEAHHSARQSYRRGRRMNSTLEAAIQEAMNELDKKMEQAKGTKSKSVPKSSRPKTRCKRLR
ncbi:uncharacterized protein LOC119720713 isoform X2 [Patiria miniata]|uniref:MBD domain-containing protein n=1 Tax=Patiria miniata TaxID=46514 RepID=A0A913Z6K5_PATMI|nr:uncharacterized protein LOC119720713 isoform X2 [Patiria miniata]